MITQNPVFLFYFHREVRGQAQLQNNSLEQRELRWLASGHGRGEDACCKGSLNRSNTVLTIVFKITSRQSTKQQRSRSYPRPHYNETTMIFLSINVPIILQIQSILSMMSKNNETFPQTESDIQISCAAWPTVQKLLIIRQRKAANSLIWDARKCKCLHLCWNMTRIMIW